MPRPRIELDDALALPQVYEETVPEDYLDVMGHMNVMWYTHIFSKGLWGVFQLAGLTSDYFKENQAGTFALEAHIKYLSEALMGHQLSIHSRVVDRSERRFHIIMFMVNHDKQDVAATLETIGTHVDIVKRRSSPFPEFIAEKFDALIASHSALDWEAPLCGSMHA